MENKLNKIDKINIEVALRYFIENLDSNYLKLQYINTLEKFLKMEEIENESKWYCNL